MTVSIGCAMGCSQVSPDLSFLLSMCRTGFGLDSVTFKHHWKVGDVPATWGCAVPTSGVPWQQLTAGEQSGGYKPPFRHLRSDFIPQNLVASPPLAAKPSAPLEL